MADLTGQDIGPYHVEEEIGRGGMATVYRARQHNLNRDVAIKVLPAEMSHNTTFLARFEREVKLIARLQHARILPVYDYGEFNGQPYIVMAYLTGGTLRDRLRAERLSLEHAVYYIHQIAEGLDYLHQKGVIHRDFKSSNVLLDKSQQNCFLADFGIARFQEATAVTLTGQGLVGTPAYMAPEMYEKGQLSTSVDVYALGVTLFEMLSGNLPFPADTPVKYMYAHLYEPIPNIRHSRPDLPASIQRVIQTALAKDRTYRYPTAGDLARALERAATDPTGQPYHLDLVEPLPVSAPVDTPPSVHDAPTMDIAGIEVSTPAGYSTPRRLAGKRQRQSLPWLMLGGVAALGIVAVAAVFAILVLPRLAGRSGQSQGALGGEMTTTAALPPSTAAAISETAIPTAEATAEPTQPPLGGGTGWLALNAAGRGYTVDVNCVLSGIAGCDSTSRLLSAAGIDTPPTFGAWSPDGQRIALTVGGLLYITQADGSKPVKVSDQAAGSPAWSPSGDVLAFTAGDDLWKADVACLDSGRAECLTQLTQTTKREVYPFWLPDGSQITFYQQQSSWSKSAFTVGPGGGEPQPLTSKSTDAYELQWLPDGKRFLCVNVLKGGGSSPATPYYEISLTLGTLGSDESVRLLMLSKGNFGSDCTYGGCPGWGQFSLSPDGRRVALTSTSRSEEDMELYMLDLACLDAGAETCQAALKRVTDNAFDDRNPVWSPDGSLLAFVRARSTSTASGIWDGSRNTGADVFVLPVGSLDNINEAAIKQVTSLGFVDFDWPWLGWQPRP